MTPALHSFLALCMGSNPCRPSATYVNVGCRPIGRPHHRGADHTDRGADHTDRRPTTGSINPRRG